MPKDRGLRANFEMNHQKIESKIESKIDFRRDRDSQTDTEKPVVLLSVGDSSLAVKRLQFDLAKLKYLPVDIQGDQFVWRFPQVPEVLASLWEYGTYNVMTQGAVEAFESANGLAVDGIAGPAVQQALQKDLSQGATDPYAYTFINVDQNNPETLSLWDNGAVTLTTLVNTGLPGASTPDGTFSVYLRYRSQTMEGTNLDGTHYADPGVPYISYFYESDAVHGFVRSSYGFPQSLGCVEEPLSVAGTVWNTINYGTLVHIGWSSVQEVPAPSSVPVGTIQVPNTHKKKHTASTQGKNVGSLIKDQKNKDQSNKDQSNKGRSIKDIWHRGFLWLQNSYKRNRWIDLALLVSLVVFAAVLMLLNNKKDKIMRLPEDHLMNIEKKPEMEMNAELELEDAKTEDAKTEDTKTGDTKTEDTKTEDTKTEDTKTEDTKTEDTKTESPDTEKEEE